MHKTIIRLLRKKLNDLDSYEKDLKITELTHQAVDLLTVSDNLRLRQEAIVEALWAENRKLYSDLQELAKELKRIEKVLSNNEAFTGVRLALSTEAKLAISNALDKDYHVAYGESIKGKVPT